MCVNAQMIQAIEDRFGLGQSAVCADGGGAGDVERRRPCAGVNHSTVLRHISAFGSEKGVRVFGRSVSGYTLTPESHDLLTDRWIARPGNSVARGHRPDN